MYTYAILYVYCNVLTYFLLTEGENKMAFSSILDEMFYIPIKNIEGNNMKIMNIIRE